ncbi:glycosyltransferase family 2 protein [Alicyclobacillus sp. SO9]|uniref:glycosyltransferase family 2 protein n=1 Tax=Alicyclobacillus sp. SO9 TaxID=2665646 RepID=UPI0018E7CF6D|nr:glycosyltransferase family 2 protein [Alicyclobacillus sp. SO9]QQE78734.1 glycosyltransferase family 2 protein [Alicyclobacillus sp. SO9]
MTEQVAAVIVTYNRKNLLLRTLQAVIDQRSPVARVFIVDNASTDGTEDTIRDSGYLQTSVVQYVRLPSNLGGSGGFHAGVKMAYENGYEWIWIMDDDVSPDWDCLHQLLKYKMSGPVLVPLRVSETVNIDEFPALRYDLSSPFKRLIRDVSIYTDYVETGEYPETLEVEDLSFEGPLFHRSVIEKVGYPRKDFFIIGDDTEYALRIRKRSGSKIVLIPSARINRMINAKPNDTYNWKKYYELRNAAIIKLQYGENALVKASPIVLLTLKAFRQLVSGKHRLGNAQMVLFALFDSFRHHLPNRYMP